MTSHAHDTAAAVVMMMIVMIIASAAAEVDLSQLICVLVCCESQRTHRVGSRFTCAPTPLLLLMMMMIVLLRMMPPMITVTWLTVAAMMNDVGDADDDAVHQNIRNRCGSSKMRDDDDVDIEYCVLLQMLLMKKKV
jgi:hypothetical protein